MSVLSLKADIRQREWHVRYVPELDIRTILSASDTRLFRGQPRLVDER